jgi:hypothetical protein
MIPPWSLRLLPDAVGRPARDRGGAAEAPYARYRTSVQIANTLQQVLAANAAQEGTFDPSTQSEHVLIAFHRPVREIAEWTTAAVPLVLVPVATEYGAYSTATKPADNVLRVDPFHRGDGSADSFGHRHRGSRELSALNKEGMTLWPARAPSPATYVRAYTVTGTRV